MKSKRTRNWERSPAGRAYSLKYWRDRFNRAQSIVFDHYGRKCAHCGNPDPRVLSIDHIAGDGAAQRRKKRRTGKVLCVWLVKKGLPPGYQTLCMNCQFVKRHENHEHGGRPCSPAATDALRPCTCHPDDSPPSPCARKYALSECAVASGCSGAVASCAVPALANVVTADLEQNDSRAILKAEVRRLDEICSP